MTGEIYGRHRWEYVDGDGDSDRAISFNPATNPNSADLIFRTQQLSRQDGQEVEKMEKKTHLERAINFYSKLNVTMGIGPAIMGDPCFYCRDWLSSTT